MFGYVVLFVIFFERIALLILQSSHDFNGCERKLNMKTSFQKTGSTHTSLPFTMSHLPIEITYYKLHDWLQSRSSRLSTEHPSEFAEILKAAPMLTQIVRHDIPGVKKANQKNEQAMKFCTKKERETTVAIREAKKRLEKNCDELGVNSTDADYDDAVRSAPGRKLPEFHKSILLSLSKLSDGIKIYSNISGTDYTPMITFISEKGNLSVKDYKLYRGEELPETNNNNKKTDPMDANTADDEIDWGDFGVDESDSEQQSQIDSISSATSLNKDTDLDKVILSHQDFIQQLSDELHELRAFLVRKKIEIQGGSQFADCAVSEISIDRWVDAIDDTLDISCSKPFEELLLMCDSDLVCSKKSRELLHKRHDIARLNSVLSDLAMRHSSSSDSLAEGTEELDRLVGEAHLLKNKIETILRKWYSPRDAYLTGDVTKV